MKINDLMRRLQRIKKTCGNIDVSVELQGVDYYLWAEPVKTVFVDTNEDTGKDTVVITNSQVWE